MSGPSQLSDEHTLYVVMNGRVVGDINRTGKNRARLRYEDAAVGDFTPLSLDARPHWSLPRERPSSVG